MTAVDHDMRTILIALLLIALLLTACGDNLPDDTTPDAAGTVVYPCAVAFYESCDAARDLAEIVCARREQCDPLWDREHLQCVADQMATYCSTINCHGTEYERPADLDACLVDLQGAACDSGFECHL